MIISLYGIQDYVLTRVYCVAENKVCVCGGKITVTFDGKAFTSTTAKPLFSQHVHHLYTHANKVEYRLIRYF